VSIHNGLKFPCNFIAYEIGNNNNGEHEKNAKKIMEVLSSEEKS
jgi:hypothetical protein